MRTGFIARLSRHPLVKTLVDLRGNPRACLYLEPLWGVPYQLYVPYATLYMYQLGVKDEQIGFLLTFGMAFQVLASLFGGVCTDKLGRRRTTVLFDCLSWSIPTLLWMFSQNFWWFLTATLFNSMWQITNNSWNCLLVEDCDPKALVDVYTWCNISGLLAVFFAPLSGLLVNRYALIPVMRVLYGFAFLFMTAKFLILYFWGTETAQGRLRMAQTRGESVLRLTFQYKDVWRALWRSRPTMTALALMTLLHIGTTLSSSFLGLYLVEDLGVAEALVSVFPIARAVVMLLFIFCFQGKINRLPYRNAMGAGIVLYIAAQLLLVLAPRGGGFAQWAALGAYMLCEALGYSVLIPRKDSLLALFVDPQERARTLGLLYVVMIGCAAPFGWIGGKLSAINRYLPFALNAVLYALCAAIIFFSNVIQKQDEVGS